MTKTALINRAELGFGFQPDFEIACMRTTLRDPDFPGSQGDGLMGGHMVGLGIDGRALKEG
jgi:hypothetical protein